MKDRDASRHPGPFRIMQVDSEIAGLLVAVGFLVMGFVSMPIATWFVLGAVALGVVVALLLRFAPKTFRRVVLGAAIIFVAVVLFWEGRKPRQPPTVSSDALYVLPDNVSFTLHKTGYWVDCWFDEHANVGRCKLTDEKGAVLFEDVFVPCIGKEPLHQSVLVFNGRRLWTADIWNRSPEKGTKVPDRFRDWPILASPKLLCRSQARCVLSSSLKHADVTRRFHQLLGTASRSAVVGVIAIFRQPPPCSLSSDAARDARDGSRNLSPIWTLGELAGLLGRLHQIAA